MVDDSSPQNSLDRVLQAGALSRRQLLGALAACGLGVGALDLLTGCAAPASLSDAASAPVTTAAENLCLIVLDGFRPEYFQLASMPAVDALAASGIFYERAWVGQLESETPSGHATLTSGSLPKHDGIIGFEWRDPNTRREVMDGWEDPQVGLIGRDMQHVHASSIPAAVKQADPSATVVALSSEKIYAADAMGAGSADYVMYHRQGGGRVTPTGLPGFRPPSDLLSRPELSLPLPLKHFSDWDMLSARLALAAFAEVRPRVLMVNLPGSDYYGHKFGGLDSKGVMSRVIAGQDRQIARIVEAYRDAGLFDKTLFVVTADHGMVPNHHDVDPKQVTAAVGRAGAQYLFHTGGTGKYVYLKDNSRNRAEAVAQELRKLPNVAAAYFRTPEGEYRQVGPKLDPVLDGVYRYLTSTFSGPTAPDVVAPYRENTIGTTFSVLYGNHGGLSWGVQHIPLVLSGPGVKRGVRSKSAARLVDVAPTVLRLMGVPLPSRDGVVLADALQKPTAQDLSAQLKLQAGLTVHQEALREQAEGERRADRNAGILPRPRVPLKP